MFPIFIILSMIARVAHSSLSLPSITSPPLQPPFFKRDSNRSILPLARHCTLISFLIYRLIIRMSLQCPHWAAEGVIEQHKRYLKEGWIIELKGKVGVAGPRPAFSGGWLISGGIRPGTTVSHVYLNLDFHIHHIISLTGIAAQSGGKSILEF